MNALNEVNKVISSVSYYTHRHNPEEEEWLTAERMAVSSAQLLTFALCMKKFFVSKIHFFLYLIILPQEWIQQNHILSIVLRDSLHQPQYVEKLEKILRFVIKEKALTMQDLDNIWAAQVHSAVL